MSALGGEIRGAEIHVALPADTLFDFDSATIRAEAEVELRKLADLIAATKGAVRLVGHTDSKGATDYNLRLSEQRAKSVADWLVQKGTAANRLSIEGKGATEPVAENQSSDSKDNPEGRARNRRVEAVIAK